MVPAQEARREKAMTGQHGHDDREQEVQVRTEILTPGAEEFKFKLPETAPLLEVMQRGAALAHATLLPTGDAPLDRLHNILKHDEVGPAIVDLDQAVGEFIRQPRTTKDFGIEIVLSFRVNTRWAVAPKPELSPREILALPEINLDHTQYSLYFPNSTDLLPLDTPIKIERGMAFEAQRDGRYGA
jgi:hypothetical protein